MRHLDLQLNNKVAVVTGASKGIGLAVTARARRRGRARRRRRAAAWTRLAGIDGVTPVAVDLAEPDGPARLVERGRRATSAGSTSWSTTSAACTPRLDGFLSLTDDDFEASLQLNFFAALRATRAAVADMTRPRGGRRSSTSPPSTPSSSPTARSSTTAPPRQRCSTSPSRCRRSSGPQGIRINSVSPGPVATDLWLGDDGVAATVGQATGAGADAVRDQAAAGMPTGRFTTPEEVATIVALLASPRTANVTGASWVIDGGLIKTT